MSAAYGNSVHMDTYAHSSQPIRVLTILAVVACLNVGACSKRNDNEPTVGADAYESQLAACRQLFLQNPRVPIVGGGYLDARRFAFIVPTVRFEDERCGTDGFETSFYWTGKNIVPASERFTGLPPTQIPPDWKQLNVTARFGNQRKARECRQEPNPQKCVDARHQNPGLPPTWPEERIVGPKAYPSLEIWLPPTGYSKKVAGISFVIKDWPKANGRPREIDCWYLPGYDLSSMTKAEFEILDFGEKTFACRIQFWDFQFKGGAARISTGTDALPNIAASLKQLQQYIDDSIDLEDNK